MNYTIHKEVVALAQKVLAVAVIKRKEKGIIFDWAVYIDAVDGRNHENEYDNVAQSGCKQSTKIGKVLFPHLDITKYRR